MTKRFASYRQLITKQLEKLGYSSEWMLLNAVDQGVPQYRTRAFLMAYKNRVNGSVKWPKANGCQQTVGDAIGDLMAANGWRGAVSWAKKANRPAPTLVGGSHKHGGPDLGPTRARREWAALQVDGLGIADAPPAKNSKVEMPRLTVEMAARLQTFPDDWLFQGGKTHRYRQVGNALPVTLATTVARSVKSCLAK